MFEHLSRGTSIRKQIFSEAFDGDGLDFDRQQRARKKYLEQIYEELEALVAPSAKVTTTVLKIAKLSEEVFDASMNKHLDLNARGG